MERYNINAEWARKQATSVLGEKVKKEIDTCLDAIEKAVARNEMSISLGIYVESLTLEDLRKRGFTVNQYDDQRDGYYLFIGW
jgi:hypothetical protein